MKSKSPILDGANQAQKMKLTTLGDKERVTVDGEPGTVIDSPTRDSYIVQLDSGETVHRMRTTIERMPAEVIPEPYTDDPSVTAFDAARGDKITASPKAANVQPLKPALDDEPGRTPGEWCISEHPNGYKLEIVADDGIVCTVAGTSCTNQETASNARLIAAAPELLRALQTYGGCEGGFCSCPMENPNARDDLHSTQCRDARNAIARAKGR